MKCLDNPEYKYFIVNTETGEILSGWEFVEDANDAFEDMPEELQEVSDTYSRRTLNKLR